MQRKHTLLKCEIARKGSLLRKNVYSPRNDKSSYKFYKLTHRPINLKRFFLLLISVSFSLTSFDISYSDVSRSNILKSKTDEIWYKMLPDCPCMSPGTKLEDGWAIDKGDIAKYHKGATISFRSYPPIKTSEGESGQQCCYDSEGRLITNGRAAGTPDKESTCSGENDEGVMKLRIIGILGHLNKDVKPWENYMKQDSLGWKMYNAIWVPNVGKDCPINIK